MNEIKQNIRTITYNTEYDKLILDICNKHKLTRGTILKSKKYRYLYDYIMSCTYFLTNASNTTRAWFTLNKIQEPFKCLTCGKILKNLTVNFETGSHRRFCCPHCECIHPDVIAKLNETNNEKYGCAWSFLSDNNKTKTQITINDRYGCDFPLLNAEIHAKADATRVLLYGNKDYTHSDEGKKKCHYNTSKRFYEKNLKNNKYVIPLFEFDEYLEYGKYSDHLFKWQCKKCNTIFESIIDYSWFKLGPIKTYARCETCYPRVASTSSEEFDLLLFIKDICKAYNYKVLSRQRILCVNDKKRNNLEIDIYIPELKFGIEYNGVYYHLYTEKTKNKHLLKTILAELAGIKLVHIHSDGWKNNRSFYTQLITNILNNSIDITKYGILKDNTLIVDRSLFNLAWKFDNYTMQKITKPKIHVLCKKYKYQDCGTIIYKILDI